MEGPSIRAFPRLPLRHAVELRFNHRTLRLKDALGNLSVGGLFIQARKLPLNVPVHVKIAARSAFEAEGVVRFSEARGGGVGIEFTAITEANRKRLDRLIEELTREEFSRPRPARRRARPRGRG